MHWLQLEHAKIGRHKKRAILPEENESLSSDDGGKMKRDDVDYVAPCHSELITLPEEVSVMLEADDDLVMVLTLSDRHVFLSNVIFRTTSVLETRTLNFLQF